MSSWSGREGDSRGLVANQMNNLFELQNGRVTNLVSDKCDVNMGDYGLFDKTVDPKKFKVCPIENMTYEAVKNIHAENPLANAYFSEENRQRLQDRIRYAVYKESQGKYVIGPQSENELFIIMRSIYLQKSAYLPDHVMSIKKQIQQLNDDVVSYSIGRILNAVQQFNGYIYDQQNMYSIIERERNVSSKGSKNLNSITSTF